MKNGEVYKKTNNSIIVEKLVKDIIVCKKNEVPKVIDNTLSNLKKQGEKPYYIYEEEKVQSAINAYIKAYDEIKKFENKEQMNFDYIFLASGTGTTQTGLICGQALHRDKDKKIVGISIARNTERGRSVIENNLKICFSNSKILDGIKYEFVDDYILGGYGKYNEEICNRFFDILNPFVDEMERIYEAFSWYNVKCGREPLPEVNKPTMEDMILLLKYVAENDKNSFEKEYNRILYK